MTTTPTYYEFVRLPSYAKAAAAMLTDAAERAIEQELCANPHAGDTIAETGGMAKLRVKLPGRGKSGGARLVYFFRGSVGRIYLVVLYGKGVQESLSAAEKKEMRRLTSLLERER